MTIIEILSAVISVNHAWLVFTKLNFKLTGPKIIPTRMKRMSNKSIDKSWIAGDMQGPGRTADLVAVILSRRTRLMRPLIACMP